MSNFQFLNLIDDEELRGGLTQVVKRAIIDQNFRQRVIDNPKAAFKEETGFNLAEDYNIQFVEQSAVTGAEEADDVFVLPASVDKEMETLIRSELEGILDDDMLEQVAGGAELVLCSAASCCTTGCDMNSC